MKINTLFTPLRTVGAAVAIALSPVAFADVTCEVTNFNQWNSGYQADVRVTNSGSAVNGWTVNLNFASAPQMTNGWNAALSTSGNTISASNISWNGNLGNGQSTSFGFQGNSNGNLATPTCVGSGTGSSSSSSSSSTSSTSSSSTSSSSTSSTSSSSSSSGGECVEMCKWYQDAPRPLCNNQDSGWGWENNQSCIGRTTCNSQSGNGGVINSCPSSSSSSSTSSTSSSSTSSTSSSSTSSTSSTSSSSTSSTSSSSTSSTSSSSTSSTSSSSSSGGGVFRVDATGNITKNGEVLPVRCGNWFGLEGQHEPSDAENNPGGAPLELYVGNMWWVDSGRTIQQTMSEITAQGINMVRLPIAPQTLNPNDPQGVGDVRNGGVLKNHESVQQTNSRQALEDFIIQANENDIQVLIDIHSCSNYVGWRAGRLDAEPPYVDATRVGYDFTREDYSCGTNVGPGVTVHEYNEEIWLNNLREIAGLSESLGVDNIIGIDIFNEPWDYTWEEWKALSESAYQAISEVNPDILIFVEGVAGGTSAGVDVPHGDESSNPNWGENFYPSQTAPLNIRKDRLVISPHTYGPSVFVQRQFMDPNDPECVGLEGDEAAEAGCQIVIDYATLAAGWDEHFGFLREQGFAMVVGEFGGNMDWPNGTRQAEKDMWSHITPGIDRQWQEAFVDYMVEKNIQACYWSINPESGDTGGWYGHEYDPVSNDAGWGRWLDFDSRKTNLLKELWGI